MRVSKAVALQDGDDRFDYMVLDELDGDRHLVIGVGHAEAFALDASLQGLPWGRPMTYQFTAALVRSLGGRVREVRLDRIVEGAYAARSKSKARRALCWSTPGPAMRSTSRS
jgi:bifunctional DNase/RNase